MDKIQRKWVCGSSLFPSKNSFKVWPDELLYCIQQLSSHYYAFSMSWMLGRTVVGKHTALTLPIYCHFQGTREGEKERQARQTRRETLQRWVGTIHPSSEQKKTKK